MVKRDLRRVVGSVWIVASGLVYASACNHAWSALDLEASSTSASSAGSTSASSGSGGAGAGSSASSGGPSAASTGGGDAGGDASVDAGTDASVDASVDAGGDAGALHCGGTDLLAWDFSSTQPSVWGTCSGCVVQSGEGVVPAPVTSGGFWQQAFATPRVYDLRGDSVFVKVTQVPAVTTVAAAQLLLVYDNSDALFLREFEGNLLCGSSHLTVESASPSAYNPAVDVYWQLRETPGIIHCETSVDGVTWKEINTVALATTALAEPSAIHVEFGVVINGANTLAGEAHFTDLNGGGTPPGHWCPVSALTDTFGGTGSPAGAWDRSYATGMSTVNQDGGTLNLEEVAGVGPGHVTSASYDLTGERVSVGVVALPTSTEGTASFQISNGTPNVRWFLHSDVASCGYQTTTVTGTLWQGSLPPLPAFVGIRESGGKVYCTLLLPSDGGPPVWADLGSITMGLDVTALDIDLSTYAAPGNTGTWGASFKDYNLPPVP